MPLKTIIYLGNKLSKHGYTPTNVETLAPLLGQFYPVITASDKKNKLLRLADMCATIICNKRKTGLVLIDTYSTNAFVFSKISGMLSRLLRLPYISILHGGNLPARLEQKNKSDFRFFNGASALVAPSNYLLEQFNEIGLPRLFFIPNNIELKGYQFKERLKISPKILWVRAFHKTYNCEMAIFVLHQLSLTYPHAELCMVGPDKDGSLELTKQRAITLGVESKVKFTGKLTKEEWHILSKDYDIFINTTHVDNTPISLIEAMALGLPVVSTNVGGIPYMLNHGQNGLMVADNDVLNMVSNIELLITDIGLANKISNNARSNIEMYNWEVVKHKWNELLTPYLI